MERTTPIKAERRSVFNARLKISPVLLATCLVLGTVLLVLASPQVVTAADSRQTSYNQVQVFAQTGSNATAFTFTAYNATGFAVATTQTQYPAASFELPSGSYVFTADATLNLAVPTFRCYPKVYNGPATGTATPGVISTPALIPAFCGGYPSSEYGYSEQDVSTSTVVNIAMQNLSAFPSSSVTVRVTYANGTAAAGASVSASVLGATYYGFSGGQSMSGTTDSNGVVTINAPTAPLQVTAWSWIPVDIPMNQTTVQRTIGGQKVNVTVYWQPTSVGLAGMALVIPPQTDARITLHVQQPSYWVMPYEAQASATGVGVAAGASSGSAPTAAGAVGGIPASVAPQYQNIQGVTGSTVAQQPTNTQAPGSTRLTQVNPQGASSAVSGITTISLAIAGAALVASGLSLSLVILRGRHQHTP